MKIGVICLTEDGHKLAIKISNSYESHIYTKEQVKERGLKSVTEEAFSEFKSIIFISSTGIAVRAIAPFIKNKVVDPAVLVMDNSGNFVISLLSGHLGGANDLTLEIATLMGAQPIITTATDNLGITAPDVISKNYDLVIEDMKTCKEIAAFLVGGEKVAFIDDKELINIPKGYLSFDMEHMKNVSTQDLPKGLIWVTHKDYSFSSHVKEINNWDYVTEEEDLLLQYIDKNIKVLKLIRRDIVLGIGCKKDYETNIMRQKVMEKLGEFNLHIKSIKAIGTVEVKKHEKAIINLSSFLKCPLNIFTLEQIEKIQHKYKGSDFVEKTIGVRAVCEPCVELSGAEIISEKMNCEGMTLCIGKIINSI